MELKTHTSDLLARLGVTSSAYNSGELSVTSPLTGEVIAEVALNSVEETLAGINEAKAAFKTWRDVPNGCGRRNFSL